MIISLSPSQQQRRRQQIGASSQVFVIHLLLASCPSTEPPHSILLQLQYNHLLPVVESVEFHHQSDIIAPTSHEHSHTRDKFKKFFRPLLYCLQVLWSFYFLHTHTCWLAHGKLMKVLLHTESREATRDRSS